MRQSRTSYRTVRSGPVANWPEQQPRDNWLSAKVSATLLVDGKRTSARLMCELFRRLGFGDVTAVHNAEDALAKLREKKYGLILADWNLEPLQFLKAVRSDDKLRRIPVLITASELTSEQVVLARRTGADALILKPFLASALRSKIEEITSSRNVSRIGFARRWE
ncbi:MAG TPA: response regulator [Beijerinckiaceae bacterium]|jgi:two-component system chemotaxis response regulator CheY